MVAWMSPESLERTLDSKMATFFSRSRGRLWVKGEESGNVLHVVDVFADCDRDTLLILVDPAGPSCHTGADNCFFQPLEGDDDAPAKPLLERLVRVIEARKNAESDKSYTRSLLDAGASKIGKKVVEEGHEFAVALAHESESAVASEAADVLYHLLVGLSSRGVPFREVLDILAKRFRQSGLDEKATRATRLS